MTRMSDEEVAARYPVSVAVGGVEYARQLVGQGGHASTQTSCEGLPKAGFWPGEELQAQWAREREEQQASELAAYDSRYHTRMHDPDADELVWPGLRDELRAGWEQRGKLPCCYQHCIRPAAWVWERTLDELQLIYRAVKQAAEVEVVQAMCEVHTPYWRKDQVVSVAAWVPGERSGLPAEKLAGFPLAELQKGGKGKSGGSKARTSSRTSSGPGGLAEEQLRRALRKVWGEREGREWRAAINRVAEVLGLTQQNQNQNQNQNQQ